MYVIPNNKPPFQEIAIQAQLTQSDSLDDIPLEERCITAWVSSSKPPPDPRYPLRRLTQCLGDDPLVLFDDPPGGGLIASLITGNWICSLSIPASESPR